jgi:hypothetical protein
MGGAPGRCKKQQDGDECHVSVLPVAAGCSLSLNWLCFANRFAASPKEPGQNIKRNQDFRI